MGWVLGQRVAREGGPDAGPGEVPPYRGGVGNNTKHVAKCSRNVRGLKTAL